MTVRIGRLEIAFGIMLALYIALAMTGTDGLIRAVAKLVLSVLGCWLAIRISRVIVKEMLWRLRNRLIVAYFFIAVVPIILITLLAGLAVAFVGGQISIYLVTSELERRTGSLRSTVEFLVQDTREKNDWAENIAPYWKTRYPGLQMIIRDNTTWSYPTGGAVMAPGPGWSPGSGLMVRDGVLYGWALAVRDKKSAMATFPITREFLGTLSPDIGETIILNIDSNHVLLHPSLPDASVPSRNRLLPPVNTFDFPIWWGAPILATKWTDPSKTETEWLNMRTRPSAVLRTVFTQKVDFVTETIPMFFFGVAILFLIAEGIALLIGVSLTRTITGAVHELYDGTVRVMKGDLAHRIPLGGKDQLGELAVSFNQMTENMDRLLAVEKERERMQTELEIAREVQNQLYPKQLPDVETLMLTAVSQSGAYGLRRLLRLPANR